VSAPRSVVLAVADDPTCRALSRALAGRADLRLVGEASDGVRALEVIQQSRPQLVFVEPGLPELDGYDVLRALPPRRWPAVVFCATEDETTRGPLRAHGFVPLPIPAGDDEIRAGIDRAAATQAVDQRSALEVLLAEARGPDHVERLAIRGSGRVEIVDLDGVEWIAAAGNYVELHRNGRRHLYRSPISRLARRLDPHRFVRIHRSAVVNVERVREMQPTPQGDWKLRLDTGEELRLSRRYREALDVLATGNGSG